MEGTRVNGQKGEEPALHIAHPGSMLGTADGPPSTTRNNSLNTEPGVGLLSTTRCGLPPPLHLPLQTYTKKELLEKPIACNTSLP